MMGPKIKSTMVEGGRRIVASLLIIGVLALGLLAASPELHGWMHSLDGGPAEHLHAGCSGHHDHGHKADPHSDEGCVVQLFIHGQILVLDSNVSCPSFSPVEYNLTPAVAPVFLGVGVDLLPPACGPPASPV